MIKTNIKWNVQFLSNFVNITVIMLSGNIPIMRTVECELTSLTLLKYGNLPATKHQVCQLWVTSLMTMLLSFNIAVWWCNLLFQTVHEIVECNICLCHDKNNIVTRYVQICRWVYTVWHFLNIFECSEGSTVIPAAAYTLQDEALVMFKH